MNVKIKKLNENAVIPRYQTKGASGFDLSASHKVIVYPKETKLIPTGLSFEIPEGFELQIRPRSGMSLKTKLRVSNSPGTVDADFRGEVQVICDNLGEENIVINIGDRIAQGVICPVVQAVFVEDELEETERGSGAFGSTGVGNEG